MKYLNLLLTRSFKENASDQLEIATFSTCTGMAVGPSKARDGSWEIPERLPLPIRARGTTSNVESLSLGQHRGSHKVVYQSSAPRNDRDPPKMTEMP